MKTLGLEELEKEQADKAKKRRDAKREKKGDAMISESDSGSRAGVTATSADHEKAQSSHESTDQSSEGQDLASPKSPSKKKSLKQKTQQVQSHHHVGKKYKAAKLKVQSKAYTVVQAIKLVKDMTYAKFPETVEVHMNLKESGIKGEVRLPHGTGKAIRAVIADVEVLKDIAAGKIEFDVLIAPPAMMPELVKYAKILGPKGLMPNPKSGTVTDKPEEAVKKFQGGAVRYSSEAKFPLLHQSVGKMTFEEKQLVENIEALLDAVNRKNIISAFVSGTMTPSVEIEV